METHEYILVESVDRYSYYDDLETTRRIAELDVGGHIWLMTLDEAFNVRRVLASSSKYNNYQLLRLVPPEAPDVVSKAAILKAVEQMLEKERVAEERRRAKATADLEKKQQLAVEREAKKLAKNPELLAAALQKLEELKK